MMELYHFQEGASDKIWGWTTTEDGALSFWGRTRGSLSFKRYASVTDAEDQAYKKQRKGYRYAGNKEDLLPADWKGQFMLAKLGQTKF